MLQKATTRSLDRDHYQVADLMTRSVAEVDVAMPLAEAAERMWSARIGSLVVLERGKLAGIITEHDILDALQKSLAPTTPVGAAASRAVLSCSPQTPASQAHLMMQSGGVRHLLVVADGGQVLGIVSDTDFRDSLAASVVDPTMPVGRLMLADVPTLPP
jgi:CBS domain-containing protein